MSRLGQIYTSPRYVEELFKYVGCSECVYGKKILENSCGNGNVLVKIVEYYIDNSRNKGIDDNKIRKGLSEDIVGYDIDIQALDDAKKRLDELACGYGIENVNWNLKCKDYLEEENFEYDLIIGNPPYITYHDLSKNVRKKLYAMFETCRYGRFDYCYAFIEKSLANLSAIGRLIYLIPYGVIKNKSAQMLRNRLKNCLDILIDYSGERVFPGVTVGAVAIVCSLDRSNFFKYINKGKESRIIQNAELTDAWIFNRRKNGKYKFGDYFKVANSVATLKNDVFIFLEERHDDKFSYFKRFSIELELVKDALSPRTALKRDSKKMKIIYPYKVDLNNRSVNRIDEEVLKRDFPHAHRYLKLQKKELSKRAISKSVHWYEYGRTQAIECILSEKLIIPMIISHKISPIISRTNEVVYAGYYIVRKENSIFSLEDAVSILESENFMQYVKNVGTPTTKDSYRISVKNIEEFSFDFSFN